MAKQTAEEFKKTHRAYLAREMKSHEGGIKYAEGQVQELKEQIEHLDNACDYCGNEVRNWGDEKPSRMEKHIAERHSEELVPALPVDYMGEERKEESAVVHA